MKITLLSPELYDELKTIAAENPELHLQNAGYEYLKPSARTGKATQIERIETILREHVVGFSKFFNFRRARGGGLELRFDYDWGAEDNTMRFTGVGYLPLEHFRYGFPVGASQC